jgi:hypothetical protein
MTIAIGVLASDGIVVAADTQESVQGYWKTTQGKVRWAEHRGTNGHGACIVSAAGNARHSDELMNRVARFFLKDSSCQQLEPTEQGIEKIVQDFYLNLRLIRFRGHVPKGGYDVPHGSKQGWPAPPPAVL